MSFDPATLFSLGQAGAWYDPSDLSTLFQDTAATMPVTTAGQPVARVNDKSGNGKNLTQATASRMPTYQVDSSGNPYLLFDGVDDHLTTALALALPFDRVSSIRQAAWVLNRQVFSGGALLFQNNISPQLRVHDGISGPANGALAIGRNGIVTERHIANGSRLAVDNGGYVTGDAGAAAPTSLSIGASSAGTVPANIRLYGVLMRAGAMTDDEIAGLRSWMADKAGVIFSTRRKARHSNWL